MLKAISELQKYIGSDVSIKVEAKNEGGLVDNISLFCSKIDILNHFIELAIALVVAYFTPKIHKTEKIKNQLEIIEKIKNGNFSSEEIKFILGEDKKLLKWFSNYYETLLEEKTITKIEVGVSSKKVDRRALATISKKDFVGHVIQEEITSLIETIEGTTIYIVSPILVKGRKFPWRGIYSGFPIEFKIEDKDFLEQVYNHEIKFGNGTSISCTLQIERKIINKDRG